MTNYKQQVVALLKSIETGDSKPLAYINRNKYVQHNLATGDGLAGFLPILSTTSSARRWASIFFVLKRERSSSIGTTCKKQPRSRVPAATR